MVFKSVTHEYFALTEEWDRSPSSILWSQDGKTLFLAVEEHGRTKLFELPFHPDKHEVHKLKELVSEPSLVEVYWVGKEDLLLSQSSLTDLSIIQFYDTSKKSLHNVYKPWSQNPFTRKSISEFWFTGYEGVKVHGFLLLPENFEKGKKYPLAFLIPAGHIRLGTMGGVRGGILLFLRMRGMARLLRRLIRRGVRGVDRRVRLVFGGIGGPRPCTISPSFLLFVGLGVDSRFWSSFSWGSLFSRQPTVYHSISL
jgi:hypothetical protein